MRTTLDLDERVVAAARAKAHADGTSIGRAVSELALRGLTAVPGAPSAGFPVLDPAPDHVITDHLVAVHRDEP